MEITEELLNEKIKRQIDHFSLKDETCIIYGTDLRINGSILRMILWNLLGCFDGHYECLVDLDTFEYKVKQHSYYGGLTWTTPAKDTTVYTKAILTHEQQIKIEGHIAITIKEIFYPGIYNPLPVMDVHTQRLVFGRPVVPSRI